MYTLEQVQAIYFEHLFYIIYPTLLQFVSAYFDIELDSNLDDITYSPIEDILHPIFDYVVIQAN